MRKGSKHTEATKELQRAGMKRYWVEVEGRTRRVLRSGPMRDLLLLLRDLERPDLVVERLDDEPVKPVADGPLPKVEG